MRAVVIGAALVLASCGQPAPTTASNPATPAPQVQASVTLPPNNCPAAASTSWSAGTVVFRIAASATGGDCASAQATITIADDNGAVVHTATYAASALRRLADAQSVDDMSRMLREWITPAGASMDTTGDLAAWAPGAPTPLDADAPFTPATGVTRDVYQALRAADAPMYCYQQSNESGLCFALRGGALSLIGTQTYPG